MSSESPSANGNPKLSAVEGLKENSRYLRGDLAEQFASDVDHITHDGYQLMKFHGSYQQDDRDLRKQRSKEGLGKYFMFMIRTKQPGGKMTADQYLVLDDIAENYANGTLRLTTRQGIQFHGILKGNVKATIQAINDCLLSTLGACGDVNRNVMACPAPTGDPVRTQMQQLADAVADHLAPRTHAYHEMWLNGTKVENPAEEDHEPIYGKVYLPRKFKTGFALPEDNCVDVLTQDLGFLAIVEDGQPVGYNVLVGGGMGRTSGKKETFPHLGQSMCFVTPDQVVAAAEAVVKLYRDHGNRADRKRARIKYLVHDWGTEKFREMLKGYLPFELVLPREGINITGVDLHLGWHNQTDGKLFLGISVENGRIKDEGDLRLRAGLRVVTERFRPDMRITAQQDLILCDIDPAKQDEITRILQDHGILTRPERISLVQRWSMACPAVPTCGLAITESERVMPALIDQFEGMLDEVGLGDEVISIRMTGCPNGCARPYASEIGLVGRSGEKYSLFVGGSTLGERLNFLLQDLVPISEVVPRMRILMERFRDERQSNGTGHESFGDWCHRIGVEQLRGWIEPVEA